MNKEFNFTPTSVTTGLVNVPFFEDARADFAPYYDIRTKSLLDAQQEIIVEMAKLGAGMITFEEGYFGANPQRYGYRIQFRYGNAVGLVRAAGLPIRHQVTDKKTFRVKLQALLNVRDWLKSTVTGMVFAPNTDILIPHLLVNPDSDITIADHIRSQGNIPQLTSGNGSQQ